MKKKMIFFRITCCAVKPPLICASHNNNKKRRKKRCVYVCTGIVLNGLICRHVIVVHTSSSFHPHRHTHSHTHTHLRTNGLTGLKVDVAFIFGYWATEQDDCDGKTLHASNETSVFSQHSETSQHSIHT